MNTLIVTLLISRCKLLKNWQSSSNNAGFTLVEMLITVVILGILAAIAFPSYVATVDKFKYGQAKIQMNCLAKEVEAFKLENGYYPIDKSRDISPVTKENTSANLKCFYQQSSGQIPFNSMYDYENWVTTTGTCIIQITFLGKDLNKDTVSMTYTSRYDKPGFYESGDDLTLSLGLKTCS